MRLAALLPGLTCALAACGSRSGAGAAAPAPKPECPTAVEKVVESFQEPDRLGQSEVVVIRQCEPGLFAGKPGFFVLASFGQQDDSKSEVGWSVYRFLVDQNGRLIAKGPVSGAGWMTGVPVGELQLVDLDGDGSDEILERVSRTFDDPTAPTRALTVWRMHGAELEAALVLVLEHTFTGPGEPAKPRPDCTASVAVVAAAGQRALEVTARTTLEGGGEAGDGGAEPEMPGHVARDVKQGIVDEDVTCLATGKYRYQLSGGAFTVVRAR